MGRPRRCRRKVSNVSTRYRGTYASIADVGPRAALGRARAGRAAERRRSRRHPIARRQHFARGSSRRCRATAGSRTAATREPTLFAADRDQPRQRREPARRRGARRSAAPEWARAAGIRPSRSSTTAWCTSSPATTSVRDRCRYRQPAVAIQGEYRSERRAALLRLGGARLGLGDGKVFVGQLDAEARRARSTHGRSRLVGSSRGPEGRLQHHERAALLRRQGHHWLRRRRSRHARPRQSIRRENRRARMDLLHCTRARRDRPRDVAARQRRLEVRRRVGLADAGDRSRARARLLLDGQSGPC